MTQPAPTTQSAPADSAREALLGLRAEIGKAVVGQDGVISGLVIALLCRGHVLLEGVPGVAKTLMVRAMAAALRLEFKRVQFTPDLMPGDVTGSLVYDSHSAEFTFRPGPVFTNLLLADEINRTPPKTQAALLEAMEERQVSVEGQAKLLPDPFIVAATQNPIEYEGTYQLPEAQLDRFLMKLNVTLPARDSEIAILGRHAHGFDPRDLSAIRPVAGSAELAAGREAVRQVLIADEVLGYIVDIVGATRSSPRCSSGCHPRGDRAAGHRPVVGVVVRTQLRHSRRREGHGAPHAAAPDHVASGSRARRGHARRRAGRDAGVGPGAPLVIRAGDDAVWVPPACGESGADDPYRTHRTAGADLRPADRVGPLAGKGFRDPAGGVDDGRGRRHRGGGQPRKLCFTRSPTARSGWASPRTPACPSTTGAGAGSEAISATPGRPAPAANRAATRSTSAAASVSS
ncbi:hypothetical protein NIIDMKKI_80980 [Mycobacterium kansasii]|uniref:ATPase AAA-3 domain-containing protein n=1 Tax=Mycobacterium kansasii TaxID=1768 RepID=A0A7G1IRP0_MYCKA|nr:hypothetical protein NIIDMKKI_80980 [Mycobacterium kansasii]